MNGVFWLLGSVKSKNFDAQVYTFSLMGPLWSAYSRCDDYNHLGDTHLVANSLSHTQNFHLKVLSTASQL